MFVYRTLAFVFIYISLFGLSNQLSANDKQPNIVFAFADDWGRCASIYGKIDGPGSFNDVVKTPNFDRLATEGVLFRHAFVSAPSCTPCRSALLSGQHFWRTGRGSILLGAVWDESIPAYPLLLKDAGYHIGKSHKVWGPGKPSNAPYGGDRFAYEKRGRRFNQFSQNVTKASDASKSIDASKEELYAEVSGNFNAFLADRKPDQPFCYWFGPTNTHRKWIKGSGKKLWGIDPDSLQGKLPAFLPDCPEVREDFADYLGEVQAVDASLGILMKRLEEIGELENTIIVASGDHGPPGFPHGKCNLYDFGSSVSLAVRWGRAKGGRVIDDLISLTDLAPTFLDAARVPIPSTMTGKSLVPLLQSDRSGKVDPSRDAIFIGRERHVDRARSDYMPYPQRAIRTQDFLYIVNFRPDRWPQGDPYRISEGDTPSVEELTEETYTTFPDEDAGPTKAWLVTQRDNPKWKPYFEQAYGKRPREELYDLSKDPDQVKNVANETAYAKVKVEMERRLFDELNRTGDPRMIDNGKFYENPPMSGPAK